jgi:hypothetical protein
MVWNREAIETVLKTSLNVEGANAKTGQHENRYLVYRMLQCVYNRQWADEKAAGQTKHTNGQGFTGSDAKLLSDVAKKSIPYKNLTAAQAAMVAKRLLKYSGQIAKVAKVNMANKPAFNPVVTKPKVVPIQQSFQYQDPDDFSKDWVTLKNKHAKQEAAQEAAAYLSPMPFWSTH